MIRLSSKKYKFCYSEVEIQHLEYMDNSVSINILLMLTYFFENQNSVVWEG